VQLTSFIGREHEIAEIKQELKGHHLVTLIGPGGFPGSVSSRRVVH